VNVVNSSTAAAGLLVSGVHQQVGNIDGPGNTQVNAGSDLTANHIIQNALVIGGTIFNHSLVTIAASDASGNSLTQSLNQPSDSILAGSLQPSEPLDAAALGSSNLLAAGESILSDPTTAASQLGIAGPSDIASVVPEPTTLLLLALGALPLLAPAIRRRS
jgi:hypothetical protein